MVVLLKLVLRLDFLEEWEWLMKNPQILPVPLHITLQQLDIVIEVVN